MIPIAKKSQFEFSTPSTSYRRTCQLVQQFKILHNRGHVLLSSIKSKIFFLMKKVLNQSCREQYFQVLNNMTLLITGTIKQYMKNTVERVLFILLPKKKRECIILFTVMKNTVL